MIYVNFIYLNEVYWLFVGKEEEKGNLYSLFESVLDSRISVE